MIARSQRRRKSPSLRVQVSKGLTRAAGRGELVNRTSGFFVFVLRYSSIPFFSLLSRPYEAASLRL